MSPQYFLYVILALFVSGVHTALSTTSPAADYLLHKNCSSSAEFPQTAWATHPTTWASNPTTWASNPTTWASNPTTWASDPTTWASDPVSWASNPTTWASNPVTWPTNPTTTTNPSSTTMDPSSMTTTNPTATSGTPTVTSSTTSTSTSTPIILFGNCPPDSLSNINSGSGLSSVSNMCGFDADSNIYGIGNRLGIYLQWVGSLIAYRFLREETYSIGAANFIFQLSNFISLLYITSKKSGNGGGTYAVECWIVLLICTGAVFPGLILSPNHKEEEENKKLEKAEILEKAGIQSDATRHLIQSPSQGLLADPSTSNVGRQTTSNDRDHLIQLESRQAGPLTSNVARQPTGSSSERDPNPAKVSTKGEVFQAVLSTATQLFAVWFVFQGMDEMFAPANSRSAFIFANVNIYHRFRTFLKVFFVTSVILTLSWTGFIIWGLFLTPGERHAHRNPPTVSPARLRILGVVANALFDAAGVVLVVTQMMKGRSGPEAYHQIVPWLEFGVVCLLFGWIIFIILSIELIIPWNHIAGAYSFDSGQWIILVAATCSLVRVVWIWRELERLPKNNPRRIKGLRNSLVESGFKLKKGFVHGYDIFRSGVSSGFWSGISWITGIVQNLLELGRDRDGARRLRDQEP